MTDGMLMREYLADGDLTRRGAARNLPGARGIFETVAHQGNELLQNGWLHGELLFFSLTHERFRECLLPAGRERHEGKCIVPIHVCSADLASEARANMLGDESKALRVSDRFGDAFHDCRQVADGDAFGEQRLEDLCDDVDL